MEEVNETEEVQVEEATEVAEPTQNAEEPTIPRSRFDQVWKQKKDLESALRAKEQEIETLKGAASAAKALEQRIRDLETGFQLKESAWQTERELMQAGLMDEEGREIARFLHGRLEVAEGEEKPSVGAWIASLKEEGAEIPPALAPYLLAPSSSGIEQKRGLPNVNAHTKPTNPTGKVLNVANMSTEEYRKYRETVLEQFRAQYKRK